MSTAIREVTETGPPARQSPPGGTWIARLALWSAHHKRIVFPGLGLFLVAAVALLSAVKPNTDVKQTAPGDTGKALKLIDERFGTNGRAAQESSQEIVVFSHPTLSVDDPAYQQTVQNLAQQLSALKVQKTRTAGGVNLHAGDPLVASIQTTYDSGAPRTQSPFVAQSKSGGDVTFALITLEGNQQELFDKIDPVIETVKAAQKAAPGFQIELGGDVTTAKESSALTDKDLSRSLVLNLPITFFLLLLAFGTVVAGLVPLGLALISILTANAILALISRAYPLSNIYSEMVLLMGLATGIDYSLFVVSRFRLERHSGKSRDAAVFAASATSGKSVAFAGITVLLSISGMFLIGNPVFTSLAIAAVVVVALAILVSLTVLPALLGDFLNRLRVPLLYREEKAGGGVWGHICDAVVKRPLPFALGTTAGLLLLAAPLLSLNLCFNGAAALPDQIPAKRATLLLQQNFTLGLTSPALVLVDAGPNGSLTSPEAQAGITEFSKRVQADTASPANPRGHFGAPLQTKVNDAGTTAEISVPLNSDIGDKQSNEAVQYLRKEIIAKSFSGSGLTVLVTGNSAANVDFKQGIMDRTPIVFAFVLGLAFLILLITFRSLVIAVKAIILNLLSVGATYGILVMVFQKGWLLERPLGFHATGIIESWIPLFLFSILFGLSMDYHMFVLSRIKEAVEHGHPSTEAVATGIKATAGTITNAALIMVAVALTFALAHDIGIKQFGFGLAIAIFLDATVIRSILLPASMELLGERNWYLPGWLGWLPHISMSE